MLSIYYFLISVLQHFYSIYAGSVYLFIYVDTVNTEYQTCIKSLLKFQSQTHRKLGNAKNKSFLLQIYFLVQPLIV